MNRQWILGGLVAVAVVALAAIAYFYVYGGSSAGDTGPAVADNGKYIITLTSRDRAQGDPKAPIQMIEYAAPTCPVCAAFDMTIFPQLKKQYIDTGKVYYVFRVFPLSRVDVAAESMARCLPPENYFPFIDQLYRNQPQWDPDGHDIPDVHAALLQMAAVAGMPGDQAETCMRDTAKAAEISQIGTDAQTKYEITATPSFIVNGEKRVGVSTWEDWQDYLNQMLAKH
ncbi:MAG TPA: DsbA family protein [Rhizomicrobium sp.]